MTYMRAIQVVYVFVYETIRIQEKNIVLREFGMNRDAWLHSTHEEMLNILFYSLRLPPFCVTFPRRKDETTSVLCTSNGGIGSPAFVGIKYRLPLL